jgi:hypothetical protein
MTGRLNDFEPITKYAIVLKGLVIRDNVVLSQEVMHMTDLRSFLNLILVFSKDVL